jgi:hypothetical protein
VRLEIIALGATWTLTRPIRFRHVFTGHDALAIRAFDDRHLARAGCFAPDRPASRSGEIAVEPFGLAIVRQTIVIPFTRGRPSRLRVDGLEHSPFVSARLLVAHSDERLPVELWVPLERVFVEIYGEEAIAAAAILKC